MNNSFIIGNVISVDGTKINILMHEHSNLETFYYNGSVYNGVSLGSYIGILRGSHTIIGRVDKEFLEDTLSDPSNQEFIRNRYQRILEVNIIGSFYNKRFEFGVKILPMLYNEVTLLTESELHCILDKSASGSNNKLPIGKSLSNNIPIYLPWDRLFNTHIGIFGNTGSGKSNTLAKIYTELFNLESNNIISFKTKSQFIILDFNGEYIADKVLSSTKQAIKLSTRHSQSDKLYLSPTEFWDIETLAILYSATEKTQKPFLAKAVEFFLCPEEKDITTEKIIAGIGSAYYNTFKQNNDKNTLSLLLRALTTIDSEFLSFLNNKEHERHLELLQCLWHSQNSTYYLPAPALYVNSLSLEDIGSYRNDFEGYLKNCMMKQINNLLPTQKLKIALFCHLIYCLSYQKVNLDYISPLLSRIDAKSKMIDKTITIKDINKLKTPITVISLRDCNAEAKKMLPLLIAKHTYEEHKAKCKGEKIYSTVHLIIDEAHNILSEQSTRESEAWKDYRLEVFEEIIKEGRKFGFYLTIASQRPYDISPTIISQIHNYFIHRLVNDLDLKMISNTVNSLDSISKSQMPNLAAGQCIITGTCFELPLLVQVEKLPIEASPTSENANLVDLWMPLDKK